MATIFREPMETRRPALPGRVALESQPNVTSNRLVNLYAGKDVVYGAPGQVADYHYPNPRVREFPHDLRGYTQSTNFKLIAKPCSQNDWPNPQGRVYPNHLRGFVNDTPIQLIGQDQFFQAPGMGPRYDYPNPTVRPYPHHLRGYTQSSNLPLIATIVVATPFAQLDWPNPRGRTYPNDLRGFTFSTPLNLIGKDQFFGAPGQVSEYDNPTPRGPVYPASLRGFTQSTSRLLIDEQLLREPHDTATPIARRIEPRWFTQSPNWPLFDSLALQVDRETATAAGRRRGERGFVQSTPITLTSPAAVVSAIVNFDTSTPRVEPDRQYLTATTLGTAFTLISPPVVVSGSPWYYYQLVRAQRG